MPTTTSNNSRKHGARLLLVSSTVAALTCLPSSSAFVGTPSLGVDRTSNAWSRSLRRSRTGESIVTKVETNIRQADETSIRQTTTTALSAFMVDEVSRAVQLFYETKPFEAAFLTCSVKASAADAIAQVKELNDKEDEEPIEEHNWKPSLLVDNEKSEQWFDPLQIMKDPASAFQSAARAATSMSADDLYIGAVKVPRNVAFLLYGGLYSGIGQHIIYNEIYPHLFGSGKDIGTVATKIMFDQLVHGPFLCLPLSYIFKAAVYQESIGKALDKYVSDVTQKGLLTKYWMVWTPFELVMYNWVPSWLIIPFISMISFFWLIVLSTVANSEDVEVENSTTQAGGSSLTVPQ